MEDVWGKGECDECRPPIDDTRGMFLSEFSSVLTLTSDLRSQSNPATSESDTKAADNTMISGLSADSSTEDNPIQKCQIEISEISNDPEDETSEKNNTQVAETSNVPKTNDAEFAEINNVTETNSMPVAETSNLSTVTNTRTVTETSNSAYETGESPSNTESSSIMCIQAADTHKDSTGNFQLLSTNTLSQTSKSADTAMALYKEIDSFLKEYSDDSDVNHYDTEN